MTARAAKAIYQNRFCYPARLGRKLTRLIALLPILAAIDLAASIGSIDWLLHDRLTPGK